MKTKDRIVIAAISLFNERGIRTVTIRDIANELDISSGNFAYHFKNKETLLEYFYEHMYDEVEIPTQLQEHEGFAAFHSILEQITTFMGKYRFFYSNIVDIFRMCPSVEQSYAANYQNRIGIYEGIILHFIYKGLVAPATDPNYVADLSHAIWFTLTFWQSQKTLLPKDARQIQQSFIINQIWRILIPCMTPAGFSEYGGLSLK